MDASTSNSSIGGRLWRNNNTLGCQQHWRYKQDQGGRNSRTGVNLSTRGDLHHTPFNLKYMHEVPHQASPTAPARS